MFLVVSLLIALLLIALFLIALLLIALFLIALLSDIRAAGHAAISLNNEQPRPRLTPLSTSSNKAQEAILAKIAYPVRCYPASRYWGLAKNNSQIRSAWLRSSDRSELINVAHKRAR